MATKEKGKNSLRHLVIGCVPLPKSMNNSGIRSVLEKDAGCPAGDSLISWGEGSSLALVGNPSRDGVSIKILVWWHFKPTPQFMKELCLLNR